MKTWRNNPQKLLIIHNQQFFSLLAWLPKRPILGRNRNFIGSPCLLSTISLVFVWKKYLADNFKSVLTLMFVTHSHLKNEWPRGQNETIFFSRETNFVGIALHLFKFSDPQSWSNHRSGNLATAQTKVLFNFSNQVLRWSPVYQIYEL